MNRPHYTPSMPYLGKQREVIEDHWHERIWAILGRPGTGKTKMTLDHACMQYMAGMIEALIVIAPNGVHRQWVDEAMPVHVPGSVPWRGGVYDSGIGKRALEDVERIFSSRNMGLRALGISFEGLQTKKGRELARRIVNAFRTFVVVDESHKVSNTKTGGYKAVREIARLAYTKRIATGTLIRQNPFSAYGQFELMGDGLLGFASLTSFRSQYAELLPPSNGLVRHIAKGIEERTGRKFNPQILARDADGKILYRNLGDLRRRLERFSSILSLADVNGTEPTILQSSRYVQLTPVQRQLYDDLVQYGVAQAPGGQLTADSSLALSTRLAQVVGGFAPSDDDPNARPLEGENPKLQELLEVAEELCDQKLLVWCKFKAELRLVANVLRERYGASSVVEYHGDVVDRDRRAAKQAFREDPGVRFFIGQQKAAGTGLDGLQAVADYMVFYSNDYPYVEREQAVARLARTGGRNTCNVIDLMAENTIDQDIVRCMQNAQDVTDAVLRNSFKRVDRRPC